ncbi:MAG TPA: hypothetical protein VJ692_06040, partial [Nitrospiraceae bacterium]|nr:hypothetical protein [Nitrospiraceae bacterium]
MTIEPQIRDDFREQLQRARDADESAWHRSRKLVSPSSLTSTFKRLSDMIEGSSLPASLREALLASL